MHLMDLIVYSLLVGVPVLILVEFLIFFSEKNTRKKKAENDRIKREIARGHHPSSDGG